MRLILKSHKCFLSASISSVFMAKVNISTSLWFFSHFQARKCFCSPLIKNSPRIWQVSILSSTFLRPWLRSLMTYDFNGLQPVRDAIWNAIFPLPSILQMEVLHHSVWKNQFLVENNWLITIWKAKPQNTLFHFLSAFAAGKSWKIDWFFNYLIFQTSFIKVLEP